MFKQNFATADRPKCMTREQNYPNHPKDRRYFHYDNEQNNETYWNWNMSHLEYDHVVSSSSSSKKSQKSSSKNSNAYYPSSRSTSSTSGLNSFFRWFRRDNKSKVVNDISYPRDIIDTFETYEDDEFMRYPRNARQPQKLKKTQPNYPPSTSQPINNAFYPSSSCDSVFSTASSFAFVPPIKYLKNRNQKQVN